MLMIFGILHRSKTHTPEKEPAQLRESQPWSPQLFSPAPNQMAVYVTEQEGFMCSQYLYIALISSKSDCTALDLVSRRILICARRSVSPLDFPSQSKVCWSTVPQLS